MGTTNIVYITFGEFIASGILRTQVLSLLNKISDRMQKKGNVLLISFMPFHSIIRDRKEILEVIKRYNLHIKILPIPLLYRFFYIPAWLSFILLCFCIPFIFYISFIYHIDVIHTRSYPAGIIGLIVSKLTTAKFIFDPRGVYPEEAVKCGRFPANSVSYNLWKRIEKRLIRYSSPVVVVSHPFAHYIKEMDNRADIKLIPCCVDNAVFKPNYDLRQIYRNRYNLKEKFVLLYSGGTSGFYNPELLIDYFTHFKRIKSNAHLLILTPKNSPELKRSLGKLQKGEYTIINPEPEEVSNLLPMGDLGLLHCIDSPKNNLVLSVKFGEYLSCGLPVVVSSSIGGAAFLVRKYNCGIVVEIGEDSYNEERRLLHAYSEIRRNAINVAQNYLSTGRCAREYLKIYR